MDCLGTQLKYEPISHIQNSSQAFELQAYARVISLGPDTHMRLTLMKKLAMIAGTSLALGMGAANAADIYHLKVEYFEGGKPLGNYTSDVALGVETTFSSMKTRDVTSKMTYVDGVKVSELKTPQKTGFLFNGVTSKTSDGQMLLNYDISFSREVDGGDKSGGAETLHAPTIGFTSMSSQLVLKPGELISLGVSGRGGSEFEVRVKATKL